MKKQEKATTEVPGMRYIRMDKRLPDPAYATDGAAGIDLCVSSFDDMKLQGRATVPPNCTFKIGTGIKLHIGSASTGLSLVGLVYPRSSLGKRGLMLQNTVGVIDSDYQGEIILLCRNMHKQILTLDPLERVAQLVIMPVFKTELVMVEQFEETARGAGGFGSTGK